VRLKIQSEFHLICRICYMVETVAVCFIANDAVLPQTIAFLESLRANSGNIPLICVAYDGNIRHLARLSALYDFEIREFDAKELNELSKQIYGKVTNRLRKLGVFSLDLGKFFLLDTDIIVLQDLHCMFELLDDKADIIYADRSPGSSYNSSGLSTFPKAVEFNSGAFLSSNKKMSLSSIVNTVQSQLKMYKSLAILETDDQPMLNFVADINNKQCRNFDHVNAPYSTDTWYLLDKLNYENNIVVRSLDKKPVPFLHYAGVVYFGGIFKAPRYRELFLDYYVAGLKRISDANIDVRKYLGSAGTRP